MWVAWILAAPAAVALSAVSAALLAHVLSESQRPVPGLPPVRVLAPLVLAWQVVAALAHRWVERAVPRDLLSRQSFSAAMANNTS